MSDVLNEICQVVERTLKQTAKVEQLSEPITAQSAMNAPREWDSLAFVSVFIAVSEHFGLEVEDDDAIHFTSIEGIRAFIEEFS